MFAFHYDFMKKILSDFKLLFTDTDSLCYEIIRYVMKTLMKKCYEHREYFDLSNYF